MTSYGYAVVETPTTNTVEPTRLLLPVANVPFTSGEEAREYIRTLHPTVRYRFTVAEIIGTDL